MGKQEKLVIWLTVAMLVLAAVIVVLVWGGYSNWFKTDFEHIYLTSNGKRLQQGEVYMFGDVQLNVRQFGGKRGYTLKIEPSGNEEVVFARDDFFYPFADIGDVTDCFEPTLKPKYFRLHCKDKSASVILSNLYGEDLTAIYTPDVVPTYKLTVTSKNGKYSFSVYFRCKTGLTDIEVAPDHVYAGVMNYA